MIYIFGKGKSAKLIQTELGCKRGFRHLPINRKTLIVNWGRVADFSLYPNVLNRNLIANKRRELASLGTLAPKMWTINSHRTIDFPVLIRKEHHTGGLDIVYYERKILGYFDPMTHFIVKYIPKKKEYRVHIFKDKCLGIARKLHQDPKHDVTQDIVWSYDNGYRHCFIDEECPQLEELGRKAVDALGLDFGAVDIILGMDGKYYVLEVNTAPGLMPERAKLYAEAIKSCQS